MPEQSENPSKYALDFLPASSREAIDACWEQQMARLDQLTENEWKERERYQWAPACAEAASAVLSTVARECLNNSFALDMGVLHGLLRDTADVFTEGELTEAWRRFYEAFGPRNLAWWLDPYAPENRDPLALHETLPKAGIPEFADFRTRYDYGFRSEVGSFDDQVQRRLLKFYDQRDELKHRIENQRTWSIPEMEAAERDTSGVRQRFAMDLYVDYFGPHLNRLLRLTADYELAAGREADMLAHDIQARFDGRCKEILERIRELKWDPVFRRAGIEDLVHPPYTSFDALRSWILADIGVVFDAALAANSERDLRADDQTQKKALRRVEAPASTLESPVDVASERTSRRRGRPPEPSIPNLQKRRDATGLTQPEFAERIRKVLEKAQDQTRTLQSAEAGNGVGIEFRTAVEQVFRDIESGQHERKTKETRN